MMCTVSILSVMVGGGKFYDDGEFNECSCYLCEVIYHVCSAAVMVSCTIGKKYVLFISPPPHQIPKPHFKIKPRACTKQISAFEINPVSMLAPLKDNSLRLSVVGMQNRVESLK